MVVYIRKQNFINTVIIYISKLKHTTFIYWNIFNVFTELIWNIYVRNEMSQSRLSRKENLDCQCINKTVYKPNFAKHTAGNFPIGLAYIHLKWQRIKSSFLCKLWFFLWIMIVVSIYLVGCNKNYFIIEIQLLKKYIKSIFHSIKKLSKISKFIVASFPWCPLAFFLSNYHR